MSAFGLPPSPPPGADVLYVWPLILDNLTTALTAFPPPLALPERRRRGRRRRGPSPAALVCGDAALGSVAQPRGRREGCRCRRSRRPPRGKNFPFASLGLRPR